MRIYLCPYCDAQLPEGARFCSLCGGAIAQPEDAPPPQTDAIATHEAPAKVQVTAEPKSKQIEVEPPALVSGYVASQKAEPADNLPFAGDVALPLPESIAAVISYATIVPAVAFLFLEPFRRNRFVRFHAWQHILLFGVAVAAAVAASILWMILQLLPFMRVLVFPFAGLIGLAWFFVWLLLVVKAYHHEWFKLPWIGDYAEEWSEAQP